IRGRVERHVARGCGRKPVSTLYGNDILHRPSVRQPGYQTLGLPRWEGVQRIEPPIVSGVHNGPALIEVPGHVGRESLAIDGKPPLCGVQVIRVRVSALEFEAVRQPFLQVYLEAVVPGPGTGLDRIILPEVAVGPSARDPRSGTRGRNDGANVSRREEYVRRRAGRGRTPGTLGVRPVGNP